jgi:hypothetical protein
LTALRDEGFEPYSRLSASALEKLGDSVRVFVLHTGETLGVGGTGPGLYLTVASGQVSLSDEDIIVPRLEFPEARHHPRVLHAAHRPATLTAPASLRSRSEDLLDRQARYVAYFTDASQSRATALLLMQGSFRAVVLNDDLSAWPFDTIPGPH